MDHAPATAGRSPEPVPGAKAGVVLWILAIVSIALLIYEGGTLITAVILPLLDNPNVIQTDFHYYYEAAVRFRADASKLYLATDDVIAGFAYPPPAIVPFVALSRVPLGVAFLIVTVASYLAIAGAAWMWLNYLRDRGREIDGRTAAAITLIALALGPTYMNAIFGQVNAFVLAGAVVFMTLAVVRPITSGASLAAGTWLKIYPALMVAAAFWDRRVWRAVAYAAIVAAIIVVIALPIVPIGAYRAFLDVLAARGDQTALHITNQSLQGFLERFAVTPELFLNWTGKEAVTVGAAVRALNWMFGGVVVAWLWARTNASADAAVHGAAALLALAAVIAPLGWGHTYVLVLPLVITHLASARRPARLALVAACVVAMMVPAGRRLSFIEQWPAWMQNVAYSRYLIATMILIVLPQGEKK
jgi:hypothetical protein